MSESLTDSPYPPAPWLLRGTAYGSVWLLRHTPDPHLIPPDVRLLKAAGRALAITFWVEYGEGSSLQYREFLFAVLGRLGPIPTVTTTHIWVDNPASEAAGNEMWGIPKKAAEFAFDHSAGDLRMRLPQLPEVSSAWHGRPPVPFRLPIRLLLAQPLDGATRRIRIRASARPAFGRLSFADVAALVAPLRDARSLLHIRLADFQSTFDS
jgi:hypothetical protein